MLGRIMNSIQSYDYLDNKKYKQIARILAEIRETFGFNPEQEDSETPEGSGTGKGSQVTNYDSGKNSNYKAIEAGAKSPTKSHYSGRSP